MKNFLKKPASALRVLYYFAYYFGSDHSQPSLWELRCKVGAKFASEFSQISPDLLHQANFSTSKVFREEQTMHFSLRINSNIVPASFPERASGGVRRRRTRGNIIGEGKEIANEKIPFCSGTSRKNASAAVGVVLYPCSTWLHIQYIIFIWVFAWLFKSEEIRWWCH